MDLAERMERLTASVEKTKAEREKKAAEQRESIQKERIAKWEFLKAEAPELAQWAMDMRSAFPGAKIILAEVNGKKII